MSSPFDVFAKDKMTLYKTTGTDKYGRPTVEFVDVLKCEHMSGGKMQRDDQGNQFVPMDTFYPVYKEGVTVAVGDYVVLGDTSALDYQTAKAKRVLKVASAGQRYFGWDNDVEVFT